MIHYIHFWLGAHKVVTYTLEGCDCSLDRLSTFQCILYMTSLGSVQCQSMFYLFLSFLILLRALAAFLLAAKAVLPFFISIISLLEMPSAPPPSRSQSKLSSTLSKIFLFVLLSESSSSSSSSEPLLFRGHVTIKISFWAPLILNDCPSTKQKAP